QKLPVLGRVGVDGGTKTTAAELAQVIRELTQQGAVQSHHVPDLGSRSGVAGRSPMKIAAGSPGTRYRTRKTRPDTASIVGTARIARLTRYWSMGPLSQAREPARGDRGRLTTPR